MDNEARITWLRSKLEANLFPTFINIIDDSAKHKGHAGAKDGAAHLTLEIASPLFSNKPLIQCHRMVYDLINEAIPKEIHALKIKVVGVIPAKAGIHPNVNSQV